MSNLMIYHDLIQSIVTALEARDQYTGDHSLRVSTMAEQLCIQLQLPSDEIIKIHMAAHVHDIGKIGIPDYILSKPDRLNAEEWELMMEHPQIGARILNQCKGLSSIADIVLHHHERWNGTGYPHKLKTLEIPFGSRVIAVCDSIDAMMSKRVYKQNLQVHECKYEISHNSGLLYDPIIANTTLQHWDEIVTPIQFI